MAAEEKKGLFDLLNTAEEKKSYGKTKLGVGGAMDIFGSFVEYNALKTEANNYNIQAKNIEVQSKQKANMIRQQFLQSAGNYAYNAARRGVSVNSGSVQSNLQRSAENMGKDMQIQEQNTAMATGALRTKAKISKREARTQKITGILDTTSSMFSAFGGF